MCPILKRVNIRHLKNFASKTLPRDSIVRDLLLSEKDVLDAQEFVGKMEIWIKLLSRV